MERKLPNYNVPLDLVADIVVFVNACPHNTVEQICLFAGKSRPYVLSGLQIAKLLGMVRKNENGYWEPCRDCSELLGSAPDSKTKLTAVRRHIQRYEPFVMFVQLCLNDEPLEDASRKVYVLFGFEGKDPAFLKDLFLSWGVKTGIFSLSATRQLTLTDSINSHRQCLLEDSLQLDSEMAIRLKINEILGGEAAAYLWQEEIDELINAYRKQSNDPRGAIECAGRAFEDFLRRISKDVGIDVTKANGICQVTNSLYYNKDPMGKLNSKVHPKQLAIGQAIGNIRNMAGHSKESKTMERWSLTEAASLAYLYLVLNTIKSIYLYIVDNTYVF